MSLNKVIELATKDLGYTESPPGTNNNKYGKAYGINNVPWCVQCQWYWFKEAGESMAFFGNGKTASCTTLYRWYKEQGQTVPIVDIQPGDIVLLNFHHTSSHEHCGLVISVTNKPNRMFSITTIEGNTSPGLEGSQDNGGCVAKKIRYASQITGVCRPMYTEEKPMIDDISGHWAEKSIKKAKTKAIMKGYPDGSFKPDQDLTRAEFVTVLDRLGLLD